MQMPFDDYGFCFCFSTSYFSPFKYRDIKSFFYSLRVFPKCFLPNVVRNIVGQV